MAKPWEVQPSKPETRGLPWEQEPSGFERAARYVDDTMRLLANGMTFGMADRLAGAAGEATGIGGGDFAAQQAQTAAARENTGIVGTGAEIAGNIATGAFVPGAAYATMPRAIATGMGLSAGGQTLQSLAETGEMPSPESLLVGSLIGATLGAGGYSIGKVFQRPNLDLHTQDQVELLNREGIDVLVGQATGARAHLVREAKASGIFDVLEKQAAAFSRAALRRAGMDVPDGRLTSDLLDQAMLQTGAQLDALARRNIIPPNTVGTQILKDLGDDASDVLTTYANRINGRPERVLVDAYRQIAKSLKTGFSGDQYAVLRSNIEKDARALQKSNGLLSGALRDMRGALDRAMDKSIAAFNPADSGLWQATRRLYSNQLVLEEALTRPATAGGIITPSTLAQATKAIKGKKVYARGLTDFDDLAKAGQAVMRPVPVGSSAGVGEVVNQLMKQAAGSSMAATAAYTMLGPQAALPAAFAPMAIDAVRNRLSLAPVMSLSPTAAGSGGRLAGALGPTAAINNPFTGLQPRQ